MAVGEAGPAPAGPQLLWETQPLTSGAHIGRVVLLLYPFDTAKLLGQTFIELKVLAGETWSEKPQILFEPLFTDKVSQRPREGE